MLWFVAAADRAVAPSQPALFALRRRLAAPAIAAMLALLLIAPTAYAAPTWLAPVEGTFPAAGPRQAAGAAAATASATATSRSTAHSPRYVDATTPAAAGRC